MGQVGRVGRVGQVGKTPCTQPAGPTRPTSPTRPHATSWNRDEWDVSLSDGAMYRIFQDRESAGWFIDAIVD